MTVREITEEDKYYNQLSKATLPDHDSAFPWNFNQE